MTTIDKNSPPTNDDIEIFLKNVNFQLPNGFIDFYRAANGADINGNYGYAILFPLTDLFQLNSTYKVDIYAPEFFLIGSDGGGMAYAIEKETGDIFEMPFIGMSRDEAIFKSKNFQEFLEKI
jgi:hypothetical protein